MKSCDIYLINNKQNFGSLSSCRYWVDCTQSLPRPVPNIWLYNSDVNKDLTLKAKAKAKDSIFKDKAKAKDRTFEGLNRELDI